MVITVEADAGGRPDRTAPELNVKGGQRYFRGCGQERQLSVGEGRGLCVAWERSDGELEQRLLEMFYGIGRNSGQTQGLPLPRPGRSLF